MLRSHKKSHYRHLLFKCANCSFESKQYQALQEHLQIEGHEPFIDENIEEFLKEYANGSMNNINTNSMVNQNPGSNSPPPLLNSTMPNGKTNSRPPPSKKRKTAPTSTVPVVVKRTSSTSSISSSGPAMSPISNDEHQSDSIHHQQAMQKLSSIPSTPLVCTLCDYVAASKEGLGVHLFQHACKKSDLLNRSLLASATVDPATKLMELFNGKLGPFNNGQVRIVHQ